MSDALDPMLAAARTAARALVTTPVARRDAALDAIARGVRESAAEILAANALDLDAAREAGIAPAMLDRLALDATRVARIADAVDEVRALPDPLAEERDLGVRPNGLHVLKRRLPLGVLAVIYEARPNVTVEAATLALKSGNAIVLRGGREAARSNEALVTVVRRALVATGVAPGAVQRIADPDRERVVELLGAVGKVDLVIPRGGHALMKLVDEHARVPVVRHGEGIVHVYVDAAADGPMAAAIVANSKVQRPGVCNALETLLVHRDALADGRLVAIVQPLVRAGVALRVDEACAAVLAKADVPRTLATDDDWDTEFLALTLAIRTVDSMDGALAHIARYGTQHTASIVTRDRDAAERFLASVEASCVLWNASTRFNDGGELGLGAEIGISTTRMHAFGPMGLRELTAEKFVVYGDGQVRA